MNRLGLGLSLLLAGWVGLSLWQPKSSESEPQWDHREEVLFWHFWGGADRDAVDDVVRRFNDSQTEYYVRAIAMPGNNLDVKLFLAITGGDPPDLVNQDDPIVADWASRDALMSLRELASDREIDALQDYLFPAAWRLGEYDGEPFALCNGLDIRALYYNQTMLESFGLEPPTTIAELDHIAETISPSSDPREDYVGYLPDTRRLWAWGYVFGAEFVDAESGRATLTDEPIESALDWMAGYARRYGADYLAEFRAGDQTLPGKDFRLLPADEQQSFGRYAVLMDGQWRCRDIAEFQAERQAANLPCPTFGVCPLPKSERGIADAGWVNGNFFVVPSGAKCPQGAWEFMKFWSGFDGHQQAAAETCMRGGWIPVSSQVVSQPTYQSYLNEQPLFREFVALAASPNQHPVPVIRGAAFLNRAVKDVGERALSDPATPTAAHLQRAQQRVLAHQERHDE